MKFIKQVALRLGSIKLHEGWRKNLDEELVAQLVEDIRDGKGETIGPVGIDRSKQLWWGHNRFEAFVRAGVKTIRCDVYAFKDRDEAAAAALRENLRRKELSPARRGELTRQLVALVEKQVETERAKAPIRQAEVAEPGVPGRRLSVHGEAVRRVAKDEKVTRQAIEKRMVEPGEPTPPPVPPPPPIETWGLELPEPLRATVVAQQEHIDKADRLNRQALAEITKLVTVDGVDEDKAIELHRVFERAGEVLRAARPAAICRYCKLGTGNCMSCKNRRWVHAAIVALDRQAEALNGNVAEISGARHGR